jgi:hypothetical protein
MFLMLKIGEEDNQVIELFYNSEIHVLDYFSQTSDRIKGKDCSFGLLLSSQYFECQNENFFDISKFRVLVECDH